MLLLSVSAAADVVSAPSAAPDVKTVRPPTSRQSLCIVAPWSPRTVSSPAPRFSNVPPTPRSGTAQSSDAPSGTSTPAPTWIGPSPVTATDAPAPTASDRTAARSATANVADAATVTSSPPVGTAAGSQFPASCQDVPAAPVHVRAPATASVTVRLTVPSSAPVNAYALPSSPFTTTRRASCWPVSGVVSFRTARGVPSADAAGAIRHSSPSKAISSAVRHPSSGSTRHTPRAKERRRPKRVAPAAKARRPAATCVHGWSESRRTVSVPGPVFVNVASSAPSAAVNAWSITTSCRPVSNVRPRAPSVARQPER